MQKQKWKQNFLFFLDSWMSFYIQKKEKMKENGSNFSFSFCLKLKYPQGNESMVYISLQSIMGGFLFLSWKTKGESPNFSHFHFGLLPSVFDMKISPRNFIDSNLQQIFTDKASRHCKGETTAWLRKVLQELKEISWTKSIRNYLKH